MASQNFRRFSWLLLLLSGFLMFYSGLFFLGILPMPPVQRFWDGGPTALLTAGILDLIGGLAAFLLLGITLSSGCFRLDADVPKLRSYLKLFAVFCGLGIIGDLIGGLYAIGAQIGLYTSITGMLTIR